MGDRPWRKQWVAESARYGRMSFGARSMHTYLIKHADDEGRIHLRSPKGKPHLGLARLCGAEAGERKRLALQLGEVLEAGYLLYDEETDVLRFPEESWRLRQGYETSEGQPKGGYEEAPKRPKSGSKAAKRKPKDGPKTAEDPPNPPESLDPLKEEEGEKEKEGEGGSPPPPYEPPEATQRRETERRIEETASALRVAWSEGWQAHTGDAFAPPSHRSVVAGPEVAAHVEAEARCRGLDHAAFAAQCVAGFFAGRKAGGRPWPKDFAQDPCKGAARRTQAPGGVLTDEARRALEELRAAGLLDDEGCAQLDAQPPKNVRRGSEPPRRIDDGSRTRPKHLRGPDTEAARRDDGHAERRAAHRARTVTGERGATPTPIGALL